MFEAFAERDYRRLWITQFISNIGWWMQSVAQGWLVYRLTESPFLLGFVGFASAAPSIVLMLPGGVLADQLDRRKVIRNSQWAQALAAAFLSVSIRTGSINVWHIIAAAFVVGTAMAFSAPAYHAMIADLLEDRSRLPNAIVMNSLQFNLSRAVGPLLAGIALSAYGPFWCFFLNAVSYIPLIWILDRLPRRQEINADTGELWERLAEGFRYVRRNRDALLLLSIVAASSVFGFPVITLMPLLARKLFANDATGLGWLMGAIGAGALAGSLALSMRTPSERATRPLIVSGVALFGISLIGASLVTFPAAAMATLVVGGMTIVVSLALCNTSIQRQIPNGMRGRVLSMYTFAFFAFVPFGNLIAGLLAEKQGLEHAMLQLGGSMVLVAAASAVIGSRGAPPGRPQLSSDRSCEP